MSVAGRNYRRRLAASARKLMHEDGLRWPDALAKAADSLICGAKTLGGTPCRRKGIHAGFRCLRHGGGSTGPKTPEALERLRERAKAQRRGPGSFFTSLPTTTASTT